jgi:hypothetical protein
MLIPVVLSGGHEESVSKGDLQFLLDIQQVIFFKRFDGWVIVGRDKMRSQRSPYHEKERRQNKPYSLDQDEVFSLDS